MSFRVFKILFSREVLVLLIIFICRNIYASTQPDSISFQHIFSTDGLSKNAITSIIKDSIGFIWIGTTNGLNRYDGIEFKQYRYSPEDKLSIPANEIETLFEDTNSEIWIGSHISGAFKYMPDQDRFLKFKFFSRPDIDQRIKRVGAFLRQTDLLWIGTDAGLIKYDGLQFTLVNSDINNIKALAARNKDEIWVGNTKGLHIYSISDNTYKKLSNGQITSAIGDILELDDQSWLVGSNKGAYLLENNGLSSRLLDGTNHIEVYSIARSSDGDIYFGTNYGLSVFDKHLVKKHSYVHDPNDYTSLCDNRIAALFIDQSGTLFAGTQFSGLNIADTKPSNFSNYRFEFSPLDVLKSNNIKSIHKCSNGNFLIGTNTKGLYIVDKLEQSLDEHYLDFNKPMPIRSVCKSFDDNFWIGSMNPEFGILRMTGNGKILKNYSDYLNFKFNLDNVTGGCFFEDDSVIWMGTNEHGVFEVHFKDNGAVPTDVVRYIKTEETERSISSDRILCINKVNENEIWIGTKQGLNVLHLKSKKISKHYQNPNDSGSLTSDRINVIFNDSYGQIWIGTAGGGLNLLKDRLPAGDSLQFYSITEKDGLSNNIILAIIEDQKNQIWVSTSYGLNRINPETGQISSFYSEDGLVDNEFRHQSAFQDENGQIYLGSINGLTTFHPDKFKKDTLAPKIVITSFLLNNKAVKVDETIRNRILLNQNTLFLPEITLHHSENIFGFRFAGLQYNSPGLNKYAFKLEGFNDNWIYTTSKERVANYTNIDAGKYTFMVKAANHDNIWSEPIYMQIEILPAPWKTYWAYMIYATTAIMIILLILRGIRLQEKYKQQVIIERKEQEMVKHINQMKLNFFTNISHEFRTPLTLIISPLTKIIKEKKPSSKNSELLVIMYRNAERLKRLIDQLMDFRNLEEGISDFKPKPNNLVACLENIFHSFSDYAHERNIDYSFNSTQKEIIVEFDQLKIENIIYNLLSNAFDYTSSGGAIRIEIGTSEKGLVKVLIIDTGIGIPREHQKEIFKRFYTSYEKPDRKKGIGIGLDFTKELVELHGGEIEVISAEGKGTTFLIRLPYSKKGNSQFNEDSQINNTTITYSDKDENKLLSQDFPAPGPFLAVIIEDNPDLRWFLKSNLKQHFKVYAASNGEEGLLLVEKLVPDIVISDIMMPGTDGISLCKFLKNKHLTAHIPIVLLTAKASVEDHIEGARIGADAYIAKPFNIELLIAQCFGLIKSRIVLKKLFSATFLSGDMPESGNQAVMDEFLTKAIKLVEDNISDPNLDIDFLTENLNVSRAQLYRKIKALSNQSVKEFIRLIRLRKAAELLKDSNSLRINEVCYKVGFSSPSYFAKSFKETFKLSPKQYTENI